MIIWAGLFDYILWGRVPTLAVLGGSSLIIASNLFILWRENKKNKRVSDDEIFTGK
jgi:drug/metabolite transporter (DMT)-like permease